ncbi:MAG: D-glucuronyl C5-epimerase family protein, partial [Acidobacteriota bacterium]|nr:D-glucuronyl C5-epimerase family protein [Acidobacteriota bacterium]
GEAKPHSLFGTLALEALAQVYSTEPDKKIKNSFLKQVDWFLEKGLLPAKDGMAIRLSREGTRPKKVAGYETGWYSYKLADNQLLKALSYAYEWTGKEKYIKKGRRILNRLINTQFDESYGKAYQGNWCDEYQIKDGCREHSEPKVPVTPDKNPCWIRPLCTSVALRCLPYFLSVIPSSS